MIRESIKTPALEDWLNPDETILWSDRPGQGIMLMPRDLLLVPFSLVWGGFAIIWEAMALSFSTPGFFPLFGIPFVLVGFFLIVGRFLLDAWRRANTSYVLTKQRVHIIRQGSWSSFRAVEIGHLPEAALSGGPNGRGTIRFGKQVSVMDLRKVGLGFWVVSLDPVAQFIAIRDAKTVFAIAQR